jgi:two-component system, LuxR family, sensor kinase FixL
MKKVADKASRRAQDKALGDGVGSREAEIRKLQQELQASRAANEELRAANGKAARTLAHDLNQPLTAAATYLKVARRLIAAGGDEPADIASALDKAAAQMLRAGEIVGRFRALASWDQTE